LDLKERIRLEKALDQNWI